MKKTHRPLFQIAKDIMLDMRKQNPTNWRQRYAYAMAYLEPMLTLNTIDEMYGFDSARSIVVYALGNLQTWRGERARELKAELKAIIK